MKLWLQQKETDVRKYRAYIKRIQKQIDKSIENALFLAKNYPQILLNESGYGKGDKPRYERIQQFLLLIKILKPQFDVILERSKKVSKDIEEIYGGEQ